MYTELGARAHKRRRRVRDMDVSVRRRIYVALQRTGDHTPAKWRWAERITQCRMDNFYNHAELAVECPCPRVGRCAIEYKCPGGPCPRYKKCPVDGCRCVDRPPCTRRTHMLSVTSDMVNGPTVAVDRAYSRADAWDIVAVGVDARDHDALMHAIGECRAIVARTSIDRRDATAMKARSRAYNFPGFYLNFLMCSFVWTWPGLLNFGVTYTSDVDEMRARVRTTDRFFCSELIMCLLLCCPHINAAYATLCTHVSGPNSCSPEDVASLAYQAGALSVSYDEWLRLVGAGDPV